MSEEKIRMPSGMGGLVRYFDDYKSKLEIPLIGFVVFVAVVVIFYLWLNLK